ncbi:MAG: aldo/keto reductase [Candidatus Hydrothermarchaeota archaeon]
MIPRRELGKTGRRATILGLGGEGVLRTHGREAEARALIERALDLGITYLESARAYSGSEAYYGLALGDRREDIFLASKSHARDRAGAWAHLETTLSNMRTDHLDLWQVHDVRTEGDLEEIFGPGGAIEAFDEAKEKGLTRFVGLTGHQDPAILRKAMDLYDFDTILIPVNPAEPRYRSFLEHVLPAAKEKKMGVIGMKVYLRGLASRLPGYRSMEPFYRFALSQGISTVVIGCDDVAQLEENVALAEGFRPMTKAEARALMDEVGPYARQLMYYKP